MPDTFCSVQFAFDEVEYSVPDSFVQFSSLLTKSQFFVLSVNAKFLDLNRAEKETTVSKKKRFFAFL